jgi:catechol 2,3-dioxygenase-like lactoylglutathione lyase family enzyme
VPADLTWTTYVLYRPGVRDAARIRLLVTDRPTPSWRRDWEPAVLGPYSIGFPNVDQAATDLRLRALGFGARNAMERSPFQMADGRTSEVQETVHTGPDFVAGVGIARGGGNPPISPIDPRGLGGPAYSMMVVPDVERMATFLRDVLGWEIRMRRVQASAGRTGALNTPDGTEFELAQLYPPGARHGFIVLLQFRNLEAVPPPNPPRLPNAGLTLYSFAVEKLEPVLERAARNGATQVTGPVLVDSPPHGRTRHATFVAPNGVMFEVYEPAR